MAVIAERVWLALGTEFCGPCFDELLGLSVLNSICRKVEA